jgi:hypothetical protein
MGHLGVLPDLYSRSLSTSALAKVTTAASVAAFGLVGRETKSVRQTAYASYSEAVIALAHAMNDAEERVRNETLLACVLMVVVESMMARDRSPNQQWAAHVSGAGQLLRQRGRTAISHDPIARRLWAVVRGFLSKNSVRQLAADETFASDLPTNGFEDIGPPPPETLLGRLTVAVTSTRDRGLVILESGTFDMLPALVGECRYFDGALCSWLLRLPEAYQYASIASDESSIPPTYEHLYSDSHLQRLWNSYRVARVTVNALIYRASMSPTSTLPNASELAATSFQNMQTLAIEIMDSIPSNILIPASPRSLIRLPSADVASEIALAFYCIWPLYVARGVTILAPMAKARGLVMMAQIVDKYAVQNGQALVDVATVDDDRPLWCGPWRDEWVERLWEWAFLYGCGAV